MSMSAEHAEQLKNEVAVVCCRTEEGTIISAANLEDPAIFPDMEDSGLLTIPDNCYKIGQVLGAKLLKTIDSLAPLTPDLLEGAKESVCEETCDEKEKDVEEKISNEVEESEEVIVDVPDSTVTMTGGVLKIKIEEGKGIDIEIPFA